MASGKLNIPGIRNDATNEIDGLVKQNYSGGSSHVADGFKPSSYTGKITSLEAGTTFAIASGAGRLLLQSLETTSITEFAVLAFGTSAADAQTNLNKSGTTPNIISNSGVVIRSGDSTLGFNAPDVIVGIPDNATHAALGNGAAGDDQVIMVTQGA